MSMKFLHRAKDPNPWRKQPVPDVVPEDLTSAELGQSQACCCPAKPVVRVIMPPTTNRPHPTELLLCGHHYRVSRAALETANALVCNLGGLPGEAPAALLGQSATAA